MEDTICRHYLRGNCHFGEKCFKSHIIPDDYMCGTCGSNKHLQHECEKRGEVPICRHHLRNGCTNPSCRFRHEPPEGYICHTCSGTDHLRRDCPNENNNKTQNKIKINNISLIDPETESDSEQEPSKPTYSDKVRASYAWGVNAPPGLECTPNMDQLNKMYESLLGVGMDMSTTPHLEYYPYNPPRELYRVSVHECDICKRYVKPETVKVMYERERFLIGWRICNATKCRKSLEHWLEKYHPTLELQIKPLIEEEYPVGNVSNLGSFAF